jgi:hypothetical protein
MEQEIKLISRKISAAKDCCHGSSVEPQKSHFASYNSTIEPALPTVRKKLRSTLGASQPSTTSHTIEIRDKSRHSQDLRGGVSAGTVNHIIIGLQSENSCLTQRVRQMQSLCENQSY